MRIVIDTSVLVAAVRSGTGASKALIDLALARRFSLLMNYPVACEYRAVALRPNHVASSTLTFAEIERLIEELEDVAEPVEVIHNYRPLSPDPNDDLVLELAINGYADHIVTNNLRHLQAPAARFRIQVLNAQNALSKIIEGGSDARANQIRGSRV
jgi:putative PIN family toxin of toxin-antitoxin system